MRLDSNNATIVSLMYMQDKHEHSDNNVDFKMIIYDIYTILVIPQIWVIGIVGCFLFTPVQLFITWSKSFFMHTMHVSELDGDK